MNMPNIGRILIAGGGIAGLSLAIALHQRGFAADLIERSIDFAPIGAGIAVQPNAMRVLHEIGLGAAVQHSGAVIRRWLMRDQHGDVLCDVDLEVLWGEVGPFIGIERAKLQDALLSGAAEVRPRVGTWATSLSQSNGGVAVAFSDGRSDKYDLVVGADGINSAMRRLTLGSTLPVYGEQMVWRSIAPSRGEPDAIEFWLGDGRFFGLCPVGAGRTYGFANVTGPRSHDPVEGRLGRIRQRFADFGAPIQDYLTALERDEQIHCGPIEWLETPHWRSGRVLLIGDAAHASSPMMGQGGSMAMEDALVLSETLRPASDVPAALETFVGRRAPRVEWVRQQSRAVGEMLRVPPHARNAALRERGQAAFHERFLPLTAEP
jgi:2-polyprenyl-6-methoxyphenol hydroxylase-like FAD-dependent oxidoreductase